MIQRIQNKPGGCCMWDGDPVYCQECGVEVSSTYTTPQGKGVCGRCAKAAFEAWTPLVCDHCHETPKYIVIRDGNPPWCEKCDDEVHGQRSPEDIFDDAMKPYGGRLKLPPPKPDSECTPEELAMRETVRGMFSGMQICGPQPLSGPSGLVFYLKSKYSP